MTDVSSSSTLSRTILRLPERVADTSSAASTAVGAASTSLADSGTATTDAVSFSSQGLSQSASDLATVLDGIAQAISAITAAKANVSTIAGLLSVAKSSATQALQGGSGSDKAGQASTFNVALAQIANVAAQSDPAAAGLLSSEGQDLTVPLSLTDGASLTVKGYDFTKPAESLGLNSVAVSSASASDWDQPQAVANSLQAVSAAQSLVQQASDSLSADLKSLQGRETFAKAFASTLQKGSAATSAAPSLDEESIRLASLQLRQQLAGSSVSITSDAQKSVLKLLGA